MLEPHSHSKNGRIIAICNQKGGVTKTTTTANLGIGLARTGKKVLLVDADPQGDLTTALGWNNPDELTVSLATLMGKTMQDEPLAENEGILHHKENVDIIPSNIELSAMEMALITTMSREMTLKNCLSQIRDKYDYILIDCMPSLGMITINALTAADSVIIPVQAQYLPAKGMTQLLQTITRVKKHINPNLKIDGVLLTLIDSRTNLAKTTENAIRTNYGGILKIFDAVIPLAVKAAETSAVGKSIFTYDPSSKVATAYEQLTKEVLSNGEKWRDKTKSTLCR